MLAIAGEEALGASPVDPTSGVFVFGFSSGMVFYLEWQSSRTIRVSYYRSHLILQ
ncbi:MAG TPA: hypothetical protein VFP71_06980 [Candidatus Angelobacter sp.]|nr:hypothetical protein [Candidatus Angelobacter sp.]